MLRNIYLYGLLSEQFGSKWLLDVSSVKEAARAINANTKGKFKEVIRDMDISVLRGKDLENGEVIEEHMVDINYGKGDFHICPVASGSGPAIGIGWYIGALLLAAAAVYVLTPKVNPYSPPSDKDNEDQNASDLYGAPLNSSIQGQVIPLIYGEVFTGSIVISQGMKAIEVI